MSEEATKDDEMSPEDRLRWLRSHGIEVETAEDRREKASKTPCVDKNAKTDDNLEKISYILIPCDASKPLKELKYSSPKIERGHDKGKDILVDILKPYFSQAGEDLDLELLRESKAGNLIGTDGAPTISDKTLRKVAMEGNVEVFPLVRGLQSNGHNCVNIYLDESGMLKRLPLNKRAGEFAERAGFNPPPKFYGNVFLGRVKAAPILKNVNMILGIDTNPSAPWLQKATMENLEHQMQMNKLTGRNELQSSGPGEEGIDKVEKEGYSWNQTEDEVEVKLHVDKNTTSKDIKVTFHSKSLIASVRGQDGVGINIKLFMKIEADESTWTLDTLKSEKMLTITLIKTEAISWPRITN